MLCFFLTVGFVISVWLKEIFVLLFRNPELQTAYGIGIIIFMSYTYRPMYWSSLIRLTSAEKTSALWKVSFIGGVLNIVLNLIFLRQYGIYAAAVNTFICLLYVGFAGFYLAEYKELKNLKHYPIAWLSLIIALTVIAFGIRDFHWTYKLLITATFTGVSLVAFKLFTAKGGLITTGPTIDLPKIDS